MEKENNQGNLKDWIDNAVGVGVVEDKSVVALNDIALRGLSSTYSRYAKDVDWALEVDRIIDGLHLLTGNMEIIREAENRLTNMVVNLTIRLVQDEVIKPVEGNE